MSARTPSGLLAAILLVGLTLRPTLTSVGPLLTAIRDATGMSYPLASMLTTLPVLTMGGFALLAGPALGRWLGERHGIAAGLLVIGLACAMRFVVTDATWLIATAGVAGCGIAVIQALMPGVIKQYYEARMATAMGFYSAAIMGGGGLGAALSPWIAHRLHDWHAGLGVWGAIAAAGLALWWRVRRPVSSRRDSTAAPASTSSFVRRPRAWALALYFGMINSVYASMVAWLPDFYMQHGRDAQSSGELLACMTACQVVAALALPWLARRNPDRRRWLTVGISLMLAGIIGLIVSPMRGAVAWVGAVGLGLGGTFALSLILTLDHLDHPESAGQLGAFVQGVGFMVASASPFATGWILDLCGSFTPAWIALALNTPLLIVMTWRFASTGYRKAMREPSGTDTLAPISPSAVAGVFTVRQQSVDAGMVE